jgi:hypothetical protein
VRRSRGGRRQLGHAGARPAQLYRARGAWLAWRARHGRRGRGGDRRKPCLPWTPEELGTWARMGFRGPMAGAGRLDRIGRALGLPRELERLRVKEQQRPSARVKGAKMNFRMLGHEEELGCL